MQHQPNVVTLPADFVAQPGNLPARCTRHGRPAVRRMDFALQSKVHIEGSRLRQVGVFGVLGMAERLGQHGRKVRVTDVKDWPLCQECVRTRTFWLTISRIMFFGGLLAIVVSATIALVAEEGTVKPLAWVFVLGFLLLPLAAFPFSIGSIPRIIGANTAPEGGSVLVVDPSEEFAAELPR